MRVNCNQCQPAAGHATSRRLACAIDHHGLLHLLLTAYRLPPTAYYVVAARESAGAAGFEAATGASAAGS